MPHISQYCVAANIPTFWALFGYAGGNYHALLRILLQIIQRIVGTENICRSLRELYPPLFRHN